MSSLTKCCPYEQDGKYELDIRWVLWLVGEVYLKNSSSNGFASAGREAFPAVLLDSVLPWVTTFIFFFFF